MSTGTETFLCVLEEWLQFLAKFIFTDPNIFLLFVTTLALYYIVGYLFSEEIILFGFLCMIILCWDIPQIL